MEKLKKAIELRKKRFSEQKWRNYHAENLSLTHFESGKSQKNCQSAVLSPENYAFEKLKIQRILRVDRAKELKFVKLFQLHTGIIFRF